MNVRPARLALALALPLCLVPPVLGEPQGEKKAAEKKAMTPEQEQMMKAYMAAATPGEPHKKMAKSAGKWKVKVWSRWDPSQPAEESTASADFSTILGGRFLQQKYKGTMMGMPFEGYGLSAYDNVTGEYIDTWMDSMGTAPMVSRGKMDESGKVLTQTGSMVDAFTKKPMEMKSVGTFVDDDHMKFEMFTTGPDGKEMKVMQLDYSRAKGAAAPAKKS